MLMLDILYQFHTFSTVFIYLSFYFYLIFYYPTLQCHPGKDLLLVPLNMFPSCLVEFMFAIVVSGLLSRDLDQHPGQAVL